jgi:hypothetical protein
MAFLRFTRDRRGYEHFQLVEPAANRRGPPRLLYWFRSPPNVKMGREPFDAIVRTALEQQYPDLQFDWPQILRTPIPSAEAETWRERRRQERAARRSAAEREQEDATASIDAELETGEPLEDPIDVRAVENLEPRDDEPVPASAPAEEISQQPALSSRRKRRRRRGRRERPDRTSQETDAGDRPAEEPPPDPWIGKERQS